MRKVRLWVGGGGWVMCRRSQSWSGELEFGPRWGALELGLVPICWGCRLASNEAISAKGRAGVDFQDFCFLLLNWNLWSWMGPVCKELRVNCNQEHWGQVLNRDSSKILSWAELQKTLRLYFLEARSLEIKSNHFKGGLSLRLGSAPPQDTNG